MKRDLVMTKPLISSFLSCEKDTETILRKLFIESRPYSNTLKRLLVIPNKDCLTNTTNIEYQKVDSMQIKELIEEGYIVLSPRIEYKEHDPVQARIVLSFDNFIPNQENPEFRDCTINFDILCNTEAWDLTDFQQRPFKILGYIDGILNNSRLSGIGILNFVGCAGPVINENVGMFSLIYRAVHGSDDQLPAND